MAQLLGLLGAQSVDAERGCELAVALRRLSPRAALFHEGAPADAIYVVRTGTFKCYRTDADGGEQVLGFARRGDVLGYGAVNLGRYTSAACALEPSSVGVVPLAELFAWLQRAPALDRALHQALMHAAGGPRGIGLRSCGGPGRDEARAFRSVLGPPHGHERALPAPVEAVCQPP